MMNIIMNHMANVGISLKGVKDASFLRAKAVSLGNE